MYTYVCCKVYHALNGDVIKQVNQEYDIVVYLMPQHGYIVAISTGEVSSQSPPLPRSYQTWWSPNSNVRDRLKRQTSVAFPQQPEG